VPCVTTSYYHEQLSAACTHHCNMSESHCSKWKTMKRHVWDPVQRNCKLADKTHTHTHLFTLVRSFPSVHAAMLLHCTTWWEALAAEVTPIRLLPCESMRNHQCFGKRTLDQSYPEWNKVTCVRAHVYLQKCSAMELLVAVLTIVLFLALHLSRVRAQMLS